jgi:hypothetical protein
MTSIQRACVITSLCNMFNDYHQNEITPDWLLELHYHSTDEELSGRMSNWRKNHQNQFTRFGIYIM